MATIRVLIADDHTLFRDGLKALLDNFRDLKVVGNATDGAQAVSLAHELVPHVVLMDLAMQGMNGLEATRLIHEGHPSIRVLILTQYEDSELVVSLLQAGASGYVLKRAPGTDLVNAIRTVHGGGTFLDSNVTTGILEEVTRSQSGDVPPADLLTPREIQVLSQIARGKSNSEIARALALSTNTVIWHRANLMSKLGFHKATDLVRYALQKGLVS